ncbi:MAG: hypothetical protein AAGJ35_05305, partial [Myxococcota bacterium]
MAETHPLHSTTVPSKLSPSPSTAFPSASAQANFTELIDLEELSLSTQNTAHDRSQFQSKFDYELHFEKGIEQKDYDVDFYLFLPNSMGIHKKTYKPEQFYTDMTNYLRIRTPTQSAQIQFDEHGVHIPSAQKYLDLQTSTQERARLQDAVVQDLRLFGCLLNTRFKHLHASFKQSSSFHCGAPPKALQKKLCRRLQKLYFSLQHFRQHYVQPMEPINVLIAEDIKHALFLVDEYLSYQWESLLLRLHEPLPSAKEYDTLRVEQFPLLLWLQQALYDESLYREQYIAPDAFSTVQPEGRLETVAYRMGLLKKFVYEVLYLRIKTLKKDRTYRNLIGMTGAALAASWAAVANVHQIQMVTRGEANFRLFFIFVLGVLAYVMKDRIKDLSKEYFHERFKRFLPDYSTKIRYQFLNEDGSQEKRELGDCEQVVRYTTASAIPPEILYIRNEGKRFDVSPQSQETILHYTKQTHFKKQDLETSFGQIRFIKDIVRLDLSHFVRKLSDPNKYLRYYDRQRGVQHQEVPKVYHLNIIFCYKTVEHYPKQSRT